MLQCHQHKAPGKAAEKYVWLLTSRPTPWPRWGLPGGSSAAWWGASSTPPGTGAPPCPSAASLSLQTLKNKLGETGRGPPASPVIPDTFDGWLCCSRTDRQEEPFQHLSFSGIRRCTTLTFREVLGQRNFSTRLWWGWRWANPPADWPLCRSLAPERLLVRSQLAPLAAMSNWVQQLRRSARVRDTGRRWCLTPFTFSRAGHTGTGADRLKDTRSPVIHYLPVTRSIRPLHSCPDKPAGSMFTLKSKSKKCN